MKHDNANPQRSKPAATLKSGRIKAAIWKNDSKHGRYYTATIFRTYRTADGNYADTSQFTVNDLLQIQLMIKQALDQIADLSCEATAPQTMHPGDGRVS
ncbi:MAG: hypothetical protein H6832_09355 [Planctomycetes bacterium]|nr:hypothetical protein [Planctomycetota bacterium]